jgi:hypothetical protein
MKCSQARQQTALLNQYRDITRPEFSELAEHLASCDLCRQHAGDAMLSRELAELDVPDPAPEFLSRALAKAQQPERWRWMPTAAAASLLVVVAAGWLAFGTLSPQSTGLAPDVAKSELVEPVGYLRQEIRIVINSQEDRSNAELTIDLAENLELDGFGGQRRLAWNTSLKKGANLLVLPVRARDDGGELRISSKLGDTALETSVRVAGPGNNAQSGTVIPAGSIFASQTG